MKICFLIAGFGQGGAQKQCALLINELSKSHDVTLIYSYEGDNFHFLDNSPNVNLVKLKFSSFYNPINIVRISSVIRVVQPDILFSWLQSSDVYSFFIKKLHKSIIWILAERDSSYPKTLKFNIRRYLGSKADLIIANSDAGKKYWIENNVDKDNVFVVKNILINSLGEEFKSNPYSLSKNIVFAGRLEKQKNVVNIAKAFESLAHKYNNVGFYIFGDGSLREQLDIVTDKSIPNFSIRPFTKDIISYYSYADIYVSMSFHEGTPNALLECLQVQTLPVLSNIKEHQDIVGERYPYLVEDYHSYNSIECVIERALLEDDKEVIATGLEYIKELRPDLIACSYVDIFKLALSRDKEL